MAKPRLLDLFCGEGGAAAGYTAAGFEVHGVDLPHPGRCAMTQRRGIWPQFLDGDGFVIDEAWRAAKGTFVGTCTVTVASGRECGQPLRPGPPFPQGRYRTGYTATCSGCGHEYGAHGPSDAPTKTTKKETK